MATIKNTLALQDNMSKTLLSITKAMSSTLMVMDKVKKNKLGPEFQQAANDIKQAENAIKNFNQQMGDTANKMNTAKNSSGSFFKSILGASAVQKVLGIINNSLDGAIKRYDTLNNYPQVMSNLGISEEQASASRARLEEGLAGLPTTLDSAVSAVQRFTSANKSIGGSTEMFLALNNALLAGGAPMEQQATALEQISQAYAKGKPDMVEWRALQSAMPAQLDQIAKVMGTTTTQLGEDLRTGKRSMNDFMQTIIQMNTEGVNGFKSFEEQAKNSTKGIGTSMANLKTAFVKGTASLIDAVNRGLGQAGFGTISDNINSLSKFVKTTFTAIGNFITGIITLFAPVIRGVQQIIGFVQRFWNVFKPILVGLAIAVGIIEAITIATKLWAAAQAIVNAVMAMNPITLIIIGIVMLITAYVSLINMISLWVGHSISAVGVVTGALYTLIAVFNNILISVLDIGLMPINILTERWAAFANFFGNIFNDPIASIIHLFGDMANTILSILSGIASAIDAIFGSNLASAVGGWQSSLGGKVDALANKYGNGSYEKKFKGTDLSAESLGLNRMGYGESYQKGYAWGENLQNKAGNKLSSIFKGGSASDKASASALANLDTGLGELTGSDGKGGKALKTTSNDDLLSDDDIKLLLDVATRDYQLNYQQVTPNISVTFGDVRETADIDDVMNAVGARIEELVYGDTEVPV